MHILQTAENKNRKKLLSCLIHVINYIIILHARNYCDIWYINNWHINFNLSSKYSIWTTVMCKYGFKCHVSFYVQLSGKYGIWTTVICPRVYRSHAFLCTFTVKRIECFSWTRGSQEPESLNWKTMPCSCYFYRPTDIFTSISLGLLLTSADYLGIPIRSNMYMDFRTRHIHF